MTEEDVTMSQRDQQGGSQQHDELENEEVEAHISPADAVEDDGDDEVEAHVFKI
jgi:hypothetical protein